MLHYITLEQVLGFLPQQSKLFTKWQRKLNKNTEKAQNSFLVVHIWAASKPFLSRTICVSFSKWSLNKLKPEDLKRCFDDNTLGLSDRAKACCSPRIHLFSSAQALTPQGTSYPCDNEIICQVLELLLVSIMFPAGPIKHESFYEAASRSWASPTFIKPSEPQRRAGSPTCCSHG